MNYIDFILRSAVKEILDVPADLPNSMIYTAEKNKGLCLIKAVWEAPIKHIHICKVLSKLKNPFVELFRDFDKEIRHCFKRLDLKETSEIQDHIYTKSLRENYRRRNIIVGAPYHTKDDV